MATIRRVGRAAIAAESWAADTTGSGSHDEQLRLRHERGQIIPLPGGRAPRGGERACALRIPVHQGDARGAVLVQRAKHALRRLARPQHDDRASVETAPPLPGGELDGRRAHRRRMPAEHGLATDAPARRERRGEDRVHVARRRPRCASRVVRAAHLPEDFGLPQNLGVEARRDGEQMAHGLLAIQPRDLARQREPTGARQITEPRLVVVRAAPIKLAAIAGEEEQRGAPGRVLVLEHRRQLGLRDGELLPHAHGGRMVTHANDME